MCVFQLKYPLIFACVLIFFGVKARTGEIQARQRFLTITGIKKQRKVQENNTHHEPQTLAFSVSPGFFPRL